jgi:hypothetical protein
LAEAVAAGVVAAGVVAAGVVAAGVVAAGVVAAGVVVVGETVGFAEAVAAGVVAAGADGVTVGAGVSTGPAPALQVTPFRVNVLGAGFAVPVRDPEKPSCAEPPWARAPFHDALVAVTAAPDWVATAPHACVTRCPWSKDQVSCQLVTAAPWFVTLRSAMKPPFHWLVTV